MPRRKRAHQAAPAPRSGLADGEFGRNRDIVAIALNPNELALPTALITAFLNRVEISLRFGITHRVVLLHRARR